MNHIFLNFDEVVSIHDAQLLEHGGAPGIRDAGLLMSALAAPMQTFGGQFLHPTLLEQAAAYLFHIARNHAFVDANKRTAWVSCLAFLEANGVDTEVEFDVDACEVFVYEVAEGKHEKDFIAQWLRALLKQS
jgi:death-on-curing protein